MILSVIFTGIYFVCYSVFYYHTLKRYWKEMLGPTQFVMATFEIIFIIDLLNNVIQLILVSQGVITQTLGYNALLTFKILLRRVCQIIFFKVMFSLKRVEVQLNSKYDTQEKVYKALVKLICIERVYLVFICLLLVNVAFMVFMFTENDYDNSMQRMYESMVIIVSPFFWFVNMCFVYYFVKMGKSFLDNLDESYGINRCRTITLFVIIGLMQIYSMLADDFIMLFICGYIFEDIDLIVKSLPTIDFVMTACSEQVNPLNSIFILMLLHYFASLDSQY